MPANPTNVRNGLIASRWPTAGRFWSTLINRHFKKPRRVSKVPKRRPLVALEMCGRLQ
jgi:hypothetical protein